jgi:sulfide dehydrogenase [flavocytochrome c] flavoprotein chain
MISRRNWIRYSGAGVAASFIPTSHASQGRVVVIGGGFAGASVARELRRLNNALSVSLIEANATYTACPLSNMVVGGHRKISQQQFSYAALGADGVNVIHQPAVDVDPERHLVTLRDGNTLSYEKLILAPGIDLDWQALQGYDETAAELLPHAWKAGAQTTLLRDQLRDMRKGGLVVMSVPKSPYRCPPGPYERASLIAGYLKQNNPRAKVLILDSKDSFSKKPLFMSAWQSLYGDIIEWQGESEGATVTAVNADNRTVSTDFEEVQADVANIIPPQKAGKIAHLAGVTDRSGWCPIEPVTFSSTLQPDIHVIGDAAIANAMPKSAFAANAQAKLCAVQVTRLLNGESPVHGKLINTCYSLVAPDYGISVAGVYQPGEKIWTEIDGAGGVSPADASRETRALEAAYAQRWFDNLTTQVFA